VVSDLAIRIEYANTIANTHNKSFASYRAKYTGKTIVIVATGPTLNKYQKIDNAIHVGVNRSYKRQNLALDFIFAQDMNGLKEYIAEINAYRPNECVKFYGYSFDNEAGAIPESYVIQEKANRYYLERGLGKHDFNFNIDNHIFPEWGSVIFPAVNFALFTMPAKIYLVGCDASSNGYFDSDKQAPFAQFPNLLDLNIRGWQKIKELQQKHYPNTEIISINPVGLKGIFTDEYR